jgi:glycosyltransferase involved in cell wall biosynthesis
MASSVRKANRWVMILSPLDYPFHSATSRRISNIINVLSQTGARGEVVCPVFRSSIIPDRHGVTGIDLRRLRLIGAQSLIARVLAQAIYNVAAFAFLVRSRNRILAVQYESIYTLPAALLAKIFLRCPCIGEDVNTPPIVRKLVFFYPTVRLISDFVTSSQSNSDLSRLSRGEAVFVPTAVTEKLIVKRKSMRFDKVRAVFVGTLTYATNLEAINHIFKMDSLIPAEDDCSFLVVGGPIPTGLRPSRRMRLLGNITDQVLRQTYRDANIGLMPFFGTRTSGVKSKLVEYMAAHLLVISSPEGVKYIPDLVPWVHYVPASSVEEMAQLISTISHDARRFARIAATGHKHVMRRYRWQRMLRSYLRFIEDLRSEDDLPTSHMQRTHKSTSKAKLLTETSKRGRGRAGES